MGTQSVDRPLAWRTVFWAMQKFLSTAGLRALLSGLEKDDPRLIQGATTTPPPLQCVHDWPCEAACLAGYCGWIGDGLSTVGEVEEFFAKVCFETDQELGEPAACRYLLNWFDDIPRDQMRRELAEEVRLALKDRERERERERADGVSLMRMSRRSTSVRRPT